MKHLLIFLLISIQVTSCKDKAESENLILQKKTHAETKPISSGKSNLKSVFRDEGLSSFEMLDGNKEEGFCYKTVDVKYDVVYINPDGKTNDFRNFIAKYTSKTTTCIGEEGQDRNIKVEISAYENPKKTILTINKDCDQIDLKYDTYMTTKHGCCAGEDEFEIFDYQHNSIVKADNQITVGSLPNSNIEFYVGYKNEGKSPLDVGTLTLSYGSSDKYTIYLKAAERLGKTWSPFSPEIAIESKNERDQLSKNKNEYTYTFWSLDKIKSKNKINGLVIKLTFDSDENSPYNTFEIPIIDGKLFGKDSRKQEVFLGEN